MAGQAQLVKADDVPYAQLGLASPQETTERLLIRLRSLGVHIDHLGGLRRGNRLDFEGPTPRNRVSRRPASFVSRPPSTTASSLVFVRCKWLFKSVKGRRHWSVAENCGVPRRPGRATSGPASLRDRRQPGRNVAPRDRGSGRPARTAAGGAGRITASDTPLPLPMRQGIGARPLARPSLRDPYLLVQPSVIG